MHDLVSPGSVVGIHNEVSNMTTGEKYYWAEPTDDLMERAVHESVHVTIERPRNSTPCYTTTGDKEPTIDKAGTVYASVLSGHKVYLHFADRSFLSFKQKGEDIIRECGIYEAPSDGLVN